MSKPYEHQQLESKWRKVWDDEVSNGTSNWLFKDKLKNKKYLLDMFPYPSGSGLHVGHVEEKVAIDIYARYLRAKGENVLMPTGYDSFGLPTENFAIKNEISPQVATDQNTANFREQTKLLGISYDWSRELATSDPDYYKFTQWWFNFLYERGLAYKKLQSVNWCPKDQTVLANEQVIDGKCERCDEEVVQKEMEQWFFRITDYADRLLYDLEKLDWPESTKQGQRNWIGRAEGVEIDYLAAKFTDKEGKPLPVLIGTNNPSKAQIVKNLINSLQLSIKLYTPQDLNLVRDIEEGDDMQENALKKALAYAKDAQMPVLGIDSGIVFPSITEFTPARVRRNAVSPEEEKTLTKLEIAEKMRNYYLQIAKDNGGSVEGYWHDYFALALPDGQSFSFDCKRYVTLTTEDPAEIDINLPITSILISKDLGKHPVNLTSEEDLIYRRAAVECLSQMLAHKITVYTTRPDTNFGATFLVLAPDSQFVRENIAYFPNRKESEAYIKSTAEKTELERLSEGKKKTGVFTGLYVNNRLNNKYLPVYLSDFVLATVGTGAVVGVPAHDKRDYQFAKAMGISVERVIVSPQTNDESPITSEEQVVSEGKVINSDFLNGLDTQTARGKVTDFLESKGWGRRVVKYKLRDWSISRQRYWGSPIPVIYRKLNQDQQELSTIYQGYPENVITFHAFGSSPSSTFHPWLDKQLSVKGVNSQVPALPDASNPSLSAWLGTMSPLYKSNNSVLIGRSLGGWAALSFAQTHKLRKLILVCPSTPAEISSPTEYAYEVQRQEPQTWKIWQEFINGSGSKIDFTKVQSNVGEIVVYLSTNDKYIPVEETIAFIRKNLPFARIITVRDAGHFSAEDGYLEFPQLLQEILSPVRLDVLRLRLEDLPAKLPMDVDYRPHGTAPLATSKDFNIGIPEVYGQEVRREVDTMDTFVCSSWYYFRFLDNKNNSEFANREKLNTIGPVDFYIGGAEHTVLHLLYSRFFTKVAYDAGLIDYDEPFLKLRHQGLIMGPDNRKMSKRWGNVINPTDVVSQYGADTLRMYEMFMGPLEQVKSWNEGGVRGIRRFLQRIWDMQLELSKLNFSAAQGEQLVVTTDKVNRLIESIASDIENLKFNTAISDMMKFINYVEANSLAINKVDWQRFLQVLYPFAAFITSELWSMVDPEQKPIHLTNWPVAIPVKLSGVEKCNVAVTINGKLRAVAIVEKGTGQEQLLEIALADKKVQAYVTDSKQIKKVIFVADKLLNLVI